MKTLLTLAIILFSLLSCEEEGIVSDAKIVGIWVNESVIDNNIVQYERADSLYTNQSGIQFNCDGSLISRQNSGWCATPPISYDDFEGTWSLADSILRLEINYLDSEIIEEWQLISVEHHLHFKKNVIAHPLNTKTQ